MAELLAEARMVAKSDASVLLRGDSGAGKELLARAIHKRQRARRQALRGGELRGHPRGAARVGTVRPHEGRLHRRACQPQGPVPAGRRRHPAARRDRRHAARPAGQAAARAAGARGAAGRRQPVDPGRRAHPLGHPPRPGRRDGRRPVPRRPVLPPQRRDTDLPPLSATARGHPAAGQPLPVSAWRASTASGCRASRPRR